jgi:hypothetical protein
MEFTELEAVQLPLDTIISLSLYGLLAAYAVFTAIFYYHWNEYGLNKQVTSLTLILYFITTLPLLGVMAVISFLF